MENKRKNLKRTQLINFATIVMLIVIANVIGSYVFTRFDLTSEKRYTLSKTTKDILKGLEDHVFFRVYLENDTRSDFKKLRREIKEMLDEFRAYSKFIDYEFLNPNESSDAVERSEVQRVLMEHGLRPTQIVYETNKGRQEQVLFTGALINYRDKELPIDFLENDLKSQLGSDAELAINNSIQNLEFRITEAVKKISTNRRPSIAFIEGHGELNSNQVYDFTRSLQQSYTVERIEIGGKISALTRRSEPDQKGNFKILLNYDAIIIAKPTEMFDEKDKFIIDQYIMRGGKVLWLIDPVLADMDSLASTEATVAIDYKLNLDDQLFKYGVRLNKNLVLDMNSAYIPAVSGQVGGQTQIEFFPWYYFPLLSPATNHPMVRNIDFVKSEFVSSIDSTHTDNIKKIPLLKTSDRSKVSNIPVYISISLLQQKPNPSMFPEKGRNIAYLLSGSFESLFANRITYDIIGSEEIGFLNESIPTSMIVVADGDIARNQFHVPKGYPLPLGFDQYTRLTYGNKDFLMNAVSYLIEGEGMINIRSRELKIRLLDRVKVENSRLAWQIINTIVPFAIVILFGFILAFLRKRHFTK
ncbi:MAG: gliding motility-associated ABC transporter substrate-binding protein GldG [Lentimicrobiaceae bacterium]|jgi:ABC-2 type transport system permease protein|nr:gliding motility-associated ABC transporter substrate-binding protein GldG [Lentimicrobiaceae bacterium]